LPWAATRCGRSPPCEGGGRPTCWSAAAYLWLLQSGHGHWSQPQPVHAFRITPRFYFLAAAAARQPRRSTASPAHRAAMNMTARGDVERAIARLAAIKPRILGLNNCERGVESPRLGTRKRRFP